MPKQIRPTDARHHDHDHEHDQLLLRQAEEYRTENGREIEHHKDAVIIDKEREDELAELAEVAHFLQGLAQSPECKPNQRLPSRKTTLLRPLGEP